MKLLSSRNFIRNSLCNSIKIVTKLLEEFHPRNIWESCRMKFGEMRNEFLNESLIEFLKKMEAVSGAILEGVPIRSSWKIPRRSALSNPERSYRKTIGRSSLRNLGRHSWKNFGTSFRRNPRRNSRRNPVEVLEAILVVVYGRIPEGVTGGRRGIPEEDLKKYTERNPRSGSQWNPGKNSWRK